ELGARELAAGQATLVRRDTRAKSPVPLDGAARAARGLLDQQQQALHADSLAFREANTHTVTDLDGFRQRIGGGGFFRAAWCGKPECEDALGEGTGASIRAIVPDDPPAAACLVDGAPATAAVLVARAY
ncbi:MAG TPA: proline--tRNA ligase, partial [Actinomycetota bacterium]